MTSWNYPDGWTSWSDQMKEEYIKLQQEGISPTFHDTGTHFED